MLSRLALVSGVAPVLAPLVGSALLLVMPWRGIFVVLAVYGAVMLVCAIFLSRDAAQGPPQRQGQHDGLQRYRSVFSDRVFIGVLDHRRHDLQRAVLVPVVVVVPLPADATASTRSSTACCSRSTRSASCVGVQAASRLAARFGPQWVMAWSTAVLVVAASAIIVVRPAGLRAVGHRRAAVLLHDRVRVHLPVRAGARARPPRQGGGHGASIIGATNFGVAGLISPIVGWIARDAGITATTMAAVMVGCAVIGVLSLWLIVRPRTVALLDPVARPQAASRQQARADASRRRTARGRMGR